MDEVIEPEQSSASPDNILEAQLRPWLPCLQNVVTPDIKFLF
jgi:hypothetical protein